MAALRHYGIGGGGAGSLNPSGSRQAKQTGTSRQRLRELLPEVEFQQAISVVEAIAAKTEDRRMPLRPQIRPFSQSYAATVASP
jgi:hypothetical protein